MSKNSFKVDKSLTLKPQVSAPSNPENGDLYYDSTLNKFRKYENGAWSDISGSGDVSGPSSSVDKEIPFYDGTSGKIISNNSGIIIPSSGNLQASSDTLFLGADNNALAELKNVAGTEFEVYGGAVLGTSLKVGTNAEVEADLTVKGFTNLNTSLNGPLKADAGLVLSENINLGSEVSGILPADNGGVKNFIANPFANNGTAGVSTYLNTPGAAPTTGSGGSPAYAVVSTTTTNPLSGINSFLFTKNSAVAAQGEGWSIAFSVDNASKAKVLDIEFDYIVNSGTYNAGSSNLSPGDIRIWIYDVTNAQLIQPSTIWLGSNSSTISDKFRSTFQTSATGTNYRLIFHIGTTNINQFALKVDNISIAPSKYVYGTPITDWRVYTPTVTTASGTMTNHIVTGYWRRIGDSAEYNIFLNFVGAPGTWVQPRFSMPPGQVIDTSTLSYSAESVSLTDTGSNVYSGIITNISTTVVGIDALQTTGTPAAVQALALTSTVPFTWASSDQMRINFSRKIVGWSSSVQMSDNADTRVVAFSTAPQAVTTVINTTALLTLGATIVDTHAGRASNQYTVPVSGYYRIKAYAGYGFSNANTTNTHGLVVRRNSVALIDRSFIGSGANSYTGTGGPIGHVEASGVHFLNANDVLNVYWSTDHSSDYVWLKSFEVEKVSGPSAIAANETVAVAAFSTSGQVITVNTWSTIIFNSVEDNTHGAYNASTGIFTVPVSGRYSLYSKIVCTNSGSIGTLSLRLLVNGTVRAYGETVTPAINTNYNVHVSTEDLKLNANDQVSVQFHQNQTSPNVALVTVSPLNSFTVHKIGP